MDSMVQLNVCGMKELNTCNLEILNFHPSSSRGEEGKVKILNLTMSSSSTSGITHRNTSKSQKVTLIWQ